MTGAELNSGIETSLKSAWWWISRTEQIYKEIEQIEAEGFTHESQERYDRLHEELKTFIGKGRLELNTLDKVEEQIIRYLKDGNK